MNSKSYFIDEGINQYNFFNVKWSFSAAKAALEMQMSVRQSVSLSVCQSVSLSVCPSTLVLNI